MTQITANTPLAIYVHWPFCKSKCPYCDFNSHVRESVDQDRWCHALLSELSHMARLAPNHQVSSIFFGGGTPSLMPASTTEAIINAVTQHWPTHSDIEITLEANPTSVEAATFDDFKRAGINRVSLGVQSLYDEALAFLGREHTAQEALTAVDKAAKTFDRYSFDLIYARPEQTAATWEKELRQALQYVDSHLSLYQLTIEENTTFHHAYHHKGAFTLPPDESASDLFTLTLDIMSDAGLPAYEVSNHARPGQESRHNMSYWRGDSYIGIGPGAHGRPRIEDTWWACHTFKSPERWLQAVKSHGQGIEAIDALTPSERAEEYVMMGLRVAEGIDLQQHQLDAHLDSKRISLYCEEGLLTLHGQQLRPTRRGWLVLNHLIAELLV